MYDIAVLKWTRAQLVNKLEENPAGKLKTKIKGKGYIFSLSKMLEECDRLLEAAEKDSLKVVILCKNCSAYTGGTGAPRGCCFKKEFSSGRFAHDFCSLYEIDGKQQRRGLY